MSKVLRKKNADQGRRFFVVYSEIRASCQAGRPRLPSSSRDRL